MQPLVLCLSVLSAFTPSPDPFLFLIIPYIPLLVLVGYTPLFGESFPFRGWFRLGQGLLSREEGGRCWQAESGPAGCGRSVQCKEGGEEGRCRCEGQSEEMRVERGRVEGRIGRGRIERRQEAQVDLGWFRSSEQRARAGV